ncbi:keratin-associated protein 6-3-like [Chionomys nivalis]|uniref:keratin-associated protein 6-3-like n=1 Tax=Chionomys nivalis TaxID=269649 RepID=UPI002591F3CD|nr:keratin-associated protein 6-3-like [Chionomys nivalis]
MYVSTIATVITKAQASRVMVLPTMVVDKESHGMRVRGDHFYSSSHISSIKLQYNWIYVEVFAQLGFELCAGTTSTTSTMCGYYGNYYGGRGYGCCGYGGLGYGYGGLGYGCSGYGGLGYGYGGLGYGYGGLGCGYGSYSGCGYRGLGCGYGCGYGYGSRSLCGCGYGCGSGYGSGFGYYY